MKPSAQSTAFVGRREELELIGSYARAASSGETRWISVCGEPGIGKSALIARGCVGLDIPVFLSRPEQTQRTPPYGTLEPLIRDLLTSHDIAAESLDSPGLAAIAPYLASEAQIERQRRLELGHKEQAVDAFLSGLLARCGPEPVVFVIDDAHDADEQSVRALSRLFTRQTTASLLLLTTRRPFERVPNFTLEAAVEAASRSTRFTEISLAPLSSEETEELGTLLGIEDAAEDMYARSAGNPLVLNWMARGNTALDPSRFVRVAIQGLTREEHSSLERFAVFGRQAEAEHLSAVFAPADPGDLRARLLERGILTRSGTRTGFFHDLIREQILTEIPDARKAEYHSQIGRIVLETFPSTSPRRDLDAGYHLMRSADPTERREGLGYARKAAEWAERAGAWEDAAGIWRDVLQFTPEDQRLLRADAEFGIGRCLVFKPIEYPARYEGAQLICRAVRVFFEARDWDRLADSAARKNSVVEFDLVETWEAAAELVPLERPGAAVIRYRRAWNRFFIFPAVEFIGDGIRSLQEAVTDRTPEWLRTVIEAAECRYRFFAGDNSSVQDFEALLPKIRALPDPVERIWWLKQLASTLRRVGQIERCRSLAWEAIQEAETARGIDTNFITICQSVIQRLDIAAGKWDEAIELGAIETTTTRIHATMALYYTGRTEEADELVSVTIPGLKNDPTHWVPIADHLVHAVSVRAWCTGEDKWLEEAGRWARDLIGRPPLNLHQGLGLAAGCARIGYIRGDRELLRASEKRIEEGASFHSRYDGHLLYRAKAQCAAGLGRRQSAVAFLHQALEACEVFQDHTIRAWTHADLADVYRELEQEGEAHRHRERALRIAKRIGLVALLNRLGTEDKKSETGRLTPREREVLTLIAEGLSDKEIAARLGLSVYTAGNHVRHIREKLHSASRSEVAATAVRLGLAE